MRSTILRIINIYGGQTLCRSEQISFTCRGEIQQRWPLIPQSGDEERKHLRPTILLVCLGGFWSKQQLSSDNVAEEGVW